MLKHRLLTAALLIPLTLALLFLLPPIGFMALTAFITLFAGWEWSNLLGLSNLKNRFIYLTCLMLAMSVMFIPYLYISFLVIFIAFLWWLVAFVFVLRYPKNHDWLLKHRILRGIMGIFVLVPFWVSLNIIRHLGHHGSYFILFLLALIWIADSGAYFVGRKWGKTKLISSVSPGKSFQGLLGALIFSLIFASMVGWYLQLPLILWPGLVCLTVATVLFSILGDLFESLQKRIAGVKDSGCFLPGHGGLLDRIDSLTAAAPIFVLCLLGLLVFYF
jgi:phosphatidate cytidylyltransferase